MSYKILELYKKNGFVEFDNLFTENQISKWNSLLDAHYEGKKEKHNIDLLELGEPGFNIVKEFFNDKIRFISCALIKDPILFYAGSNEIPSEQKVSHVNHNEIEGWHTDTGEELQYLDMRMPYWITFFVYLTNVDNDDGAFEISNIVKKKQISHNTECFKMTGKKGKCFLWGNPFYHRASPNIGTNRRRILKIQIQHNYLENSYLDKLKKNHKFLENEDNFLKYIFGSKHFGTYRDWKIEQSIIEQNIDIIEHIYNKDSNSRIKLKYLNSLKKRFKDIFA